MNTTAETQVLRGARGKDTVADCSISKQAVAGFIQLTPMARTERLLLRSSNP
jgi:hypothetical protein